MTIAYSYVRFSTPDQLKGDSLRRQMEQAKRYADEHGLELSTATYHDLGVSGHYGDNAETGQLGEFINAVEKGKVKRGSYLLIEDIDRFSREKPLRILNKFSDLLDKGIIIVTLNDNSIYSEENVNALDSLLKLLLRASLGHEESAKKSIRVAAAWQNKRDRASNGEGHKLTAKCPGWLRLNENREFAIIPERAEIVRRIYNMALEGHGLKAIARKLNDEGIPSFSTDTGWHKSFIQKLLSTPAVIGTFQPMRSIRDSNKKRTREPDGEPIEGYFPAIIDKDIYYRVKRSPSGVSGYAGKPLSNILSKLVFCNDCGGRMHYIASTRPPRAKKLYSYLCCDNSYRKKGCNAKGTNYDVVLSTILHVLEHELDIAALLGEDADRASRKSKLENKKAAVEGAITETESSITNLLDVLQRVPSSHIEQRLMQQEAKLADQKAFLSALIDRIEDAENEENKYGDVIAAKHKLQEVMSSGDEQAIGEIRVRLNAALKKLIARIEVGYVEREGYTADYETGEYDASYDEELSIAIRFHDTEKQLQIHTMPKGTLPHRTIIEGD